MSDNKSQQTSFLYGVADMLRITKDREKLVSETRCWAEGFLTGDHVQALEKLITMQNENVEGLKRLVLSRETPADSLAAAAYLHAYYLGRRANEY